MVCTVFIESKPHIFSLRPHMQNDTLSFNVTCLSNGSEISPFAIHLRSGGWGIAGAVPEAIIHAEDKLVSLLTAYLEGQGVV